MDTALLILNAGSSSLKFAVYRADTVPTQEAVYRGSIEAIGQRGHFRVFHASDPDAAIDHEVAPANHEQALQLLLDWLEARHPALALRAAGHRVVHGGAEYNHPVRVDDQILAALERLIPLSPLHQPHNVGTIHALARCDLSILRYCRKSPLKPSRLRRRSVNIRFLPA